MPTVTTSDGVEIFYKDWGSGQPIVFSHGWPLSADDWDAQMLFFLNHGYRVIAHDRRGHGRSTQIGRGHDMDHYADDLAAVTKHLDLKNVIHVVAAADLGRSAMAAPIMRDDAIALTEEEQHLRVPIVRRERPAVAEHDRLAAAPILVENLDAIARGDCRHGAPPSRKSGSPGLPVARRYRMGRAKATDKMTVGGLNLRGTT